MNWEEGHTWRPTVTKRLLLGSSPPSRRMNLPLKKRKTRREKTRRESKETQAKTDANRRVIIETSNYLILSKVGLMILML
jgi:hypothetical protein